jgi:methionyl-tRNA synthetase
VIRFNKKTNIQKNESKSNWLVTSALPYVNNIPHVGVIIGSHLPADIFTRFLRLFNENVVFVGGTDEHGSPTEVAAFKAGMTPKEFTDKFYLIHKRIYEWLAISYDNFSRTSNPSNHETTIEIFNNLLKNGFIIRKKLLLPYCNTDKRFLPDRWIEGTCPKCSYRPARGDQCENCTTLLDPVDLVKPYCVICKNEPVFKEEEHLFLDLTKFQSRLEEWIGKNTQWKENVRNLALGWLKEGLQPRCITRNLEWGIHVPLKEFEDKVFYVWFDAPIGYISSTKEWAEKTGNPNAWKEFWTEKNSKIVHFLGKDNIPFHAIIWPSILMGDGGYNLPCIVVGYDFLNYRGEKISKSKNWGVFLELVDDVVKVRLENKYVDVEPDQLRFYLSYILPETKDSNFSLDDFENRVNTDLIGNFGNFAYRVLSFIEKNFDGKVPEGDELKQDDLDLIKKVSETKETVKNDVCAVRLRDALNKALELSSYCNKYFQKKKPWDAINKNKADCQRTLYVSVNALRSLAILFSPFIPQSTERLWKQLNLDASVHEQDFNCLDELILKSGHKIGDDISPLFKKIEMK